MVVLIAGFVAYRLREPTLRTDADGRPESRRITAIGTQLFATNCSSCHGKGAVGGSAPGAQLPAVPQDHDRTTRSSNLIAGGVPGTEMPAWSLAFGGTLTDEQIHQITTYLRSLEPNAPSVPTWRQGKK